MSRRNRARRNRARPRSRPSNYEARLRDGLSRTPIASAGPVVSDELSRTACAPTSHPPKTPPSCGRRYRRWRRRWARPRRARQPDLRPDTPACVNKMPQAEMVGWKAATINVGIARRGNWPRHSATAASCSPISAPKSSMSNRLVASLRERPRHWSMPAMDDAAV
jgi:hypothetical protein